MLRFAISNTVSAMPCSQSPTTRGLDKDIDWKTVDLKKLKVKDLKKILENWGEVCKGCTEKTDFITRINELKPKFVKSEL